MICRNAEQPNQTLKQEKKVLFEEIRNIFNSMANEIANLKNANSHLREYIKCFEKGRDLLKKEKLFLRLRTSNVH